MKKFAWAAVGGLMVACFATMAAAQRNPRGTSSVMIHGKRVSVEYGRPSLKGRTTDDLLGKLPSGKLWRLGADTSTTFKTDIDLAFGDTTIPAGEYSIWMQRQDDHSWKLLFDKKHGQWGEPTPDASEIFASVPLSETRASAPVDLVTINLHKAGPGGKIVIEWGTLEASTDFTAK